MHRTLLFQMAAEHLAVCREQIPILKVAFLRHKTTRQKPEDLAPAQEAPVGQELGDLQRKSAACLVHSGGGRSCGSASRQHGPCAGPSPVSPRPALALVGTLIGKSGRCRLPGDRLHEEVQHRGGMIPRPNSHGESGGRLAYGAGGSQDAQVGAIVELGAAEVTNHGRPYAMPPVLAQYEGAQVGTGEQQVNAQIMGDGTAMYTIAEAAEQAGDTSHQGQRARTLPRRVDVATWSRNRPCPISPGIGFRHTKFSALGCSPSARAVGCRLGGWHS